LRTKKAKKAKNSNTGILPNFLKSFFVTIKGNTITMIPNKILGSALMYSSKGMSKYKRKKVYGYMEARSILIIYLLISL
jgi:hypothetical protein